MSDGFITPDLDELTDAGLLEESEHELAEATSAAAEQLAAQLAAGQGGADEVAAEVVEFVDDFKQRWRTILEMPADRVVERVRAEFAEQPQEAREILSLLIAQELGYRRLLRREHSPALQQKPLWDVLQAETFANLTSPATQAIEHIAQSTRPSRPALHPMAALATLALWCHGDIEQQKAADARLRQFALPDAPDWLYQLVGVLGRMDREFSAPTDLPEHAEDAEHAAVDESATETDADSDSTAASIPQNPRGLYALAKIQLDAKFWDSAAFIAGFHLVRRLAPSRVGSPMTNLLKACDRAADEKPRQMRSWLKLMADATLGGRLNYSWLEKPMRAAIRLSIDDPEREKTLRQWHDQRPYEADYDRIAELYEAELSAMTRGDEDSRDRARRRLLNEVDHTARYHPTRAQRLLEWMAIREHPRRVPTFAGRLGFALEQIAEKPTLTDADEKLIRLYVSNYHIEPHALELVRRTMGRVDWEDTQRPPGPDALEMYLVISDYERAFEHLTCKFDGVTLEHADKDAAARVKHFVEKRLDPNHLTRLVRTLFTPLEWIGASIGHLEFVSKAVERAVKMLDDRIRTVDLSERVLAEYREAGVVVDEFDDIARLNMGQVEHALRDRRTMRLLLSAVAGGLSGGLAPFGWAALSLADAPILLALSADICSRFCWYYGFDPREHPELPMEIMAVALGGSRAEAIEPMLLRQNLSEYALRKSLMVGAVAHGGVTQMGARTLGRFLQEQLGTQAAQRVNDLARRAVSTNLRRRAAESVPSKSLPIVGAALGASLNVALIYDVCEAAQAVLTDRFLERKYPDWIRKFDPEAHAAPDFSLD